MPIRILDASTVGRIAAGEVVERPSSVVKELVENALDAGATSITVEARGGGIDYLRVTDNGCGIEPGQLRMAFENHATSKLQSAEQLDDIRTLGFRGEALPSIAAVSRVEMTTRARNQDSGMKLTQAGGRDFELCEAGCPQGTTLVVRDLFFNVPVRRAFLKKPAYEGALVSDAVARLLLGNPGVSMRFLSGGNTLFHSFGDGKPRHAAFAVYGRETAEKLVELDESEGGTRISGLIGVGELAKATRAHELFYINGRFVRCPMLTKALEAVCRSRVTIGMYPMCILSLKIPPTGVDVNVHPNKLEVRFRDEETMRLVCEKLLARAFAGERVLDVDRLSAPETRVNRRVELREIPLAEAQVVGEGKAGLDSGAEKAASEAVRTPTEVASEAVGIPTEAAKAGFEAPAGARRSPPSEQLRLNLSAAPRALREDRIDFGAPVKTVDLAGGEPPSAVREVRPAAPSEAPPAASPEASPSVREVPPAVSSEASPAPAFRVIGVAFKTYILAECGDALILIDQHAAHERLQYEKLMARAAQGQASQQLLAPLILRLSAREMALVADNLSLLEDAGYGVERFGESEIRVSAVPFVLGKAEIKPVFLEMLQSLSQLKAATLDARRGEIMQMACKSAVKAGDALSETEIERLIAQLMATGAPPTCPHGRPVAKVLTRRELEKMFKRIQ